MDKASKAIRRSSVRLKSMGSGHGDLNMVISELKDVRSSAKAFMLAQNTAAQDMLKWSVNDENRAIQDTFTQLAELNSLWTEVQKEFTEHLKDFKYQFDMILEGERHVDQARNHLAACELRETKIKKELKKAAKKATAEEVRQLEIRLAQAERSRDLAQLEVVDRIRENEAVKLIRVKEGLLKLSESYLELAHKCHVIYEAHRDIAYELPDVQDKDIQEIKYTGSGAAKQAVTKAKERVRQYRRRTHNLIPCAPMHEDPPPPYSPGSYNDSSPYNPNYFVHDNSPFSPRYSANCHHPSNNTNPFRSNSRSIETLYGISPIDLSVGNSPQYRERNSTCNTNPFEDELDNRLSYTNEHQVSRVLHEPRPTNDDVRWNQDYEEDLAGAMGGAKI